MNSPGCQPVCLLLVRSHPRQTVLVPAQRLAAMDYSQKVFSKGPLRSESLYSFESETHNICLSFSE